ncbi:MAG: LamG domain-containing protein [Patescibacteria group bacterium]|nr:LamG domain-containing protein [Patescibacteria group bacterium]
MKKLITISFVLAVVLLGGGFLAAQYGFSGGTNAPSVPEDTMTRGLVGYWSMDEGSGQYAYDGSDNGNNGTLGASSAASSDDPKWGKGKNGGSLQFDGVNDVVTKTDNANLDIPIQTDGKITMEAWVYPFDLTFENGIISKRSNYRMVLRAGGELKFQTFGWTGALSSVNSNEWSHIAITYDGLTDLLKFYINGVNVRTVNDYLPNGGINGDDLYIGKGHDLTTSFNGSIDEVRIYNRALTADEVRYHYNRGGPVASWNFDEGSGTTVYDSSGNEFNGTLTP